MLASASQGGSSVPGPGGSAPRGVSALGGICLGGCMPGSGGHLLPGPGGGGCLVWGVSAPGGRGGGVPGPGGVVCLVWGGVCSWGVVCLVQGWGVCLVPGGAWSGGGSGIPACTEADTPLWTKSQTPVKTLPWPNFVAAGNKTLHVAIDVTSRIKLRFPEACCQDVDCFVLILDK